MNIYVIGGLTEEHLFMYSRFCLFILRTWVCPFQIENGRIQLGCLSFLLSFRFDMVNSIKTVKYNIDVCYRRRRKCDMTEVI